MKSLFILNISRFLLLSCLAYWHLSCKKNETPIYPDYTGLTGKVIDVEGNVYSTIGIGKQIWMAENLRSTLLNDTSQIQLIINDSTWLETYLPSYCWYNNDTIFNKKIYGAIYNYSAIETGLICPVGWHVPTEVDWGILESFLGGSNVAGGKLKDYYTSYWEEPNPCIVTNFHFGALPGGRRVDFTGYFFEIRLRGYWWTSTKNNNNYAFARSMNNFNTSLNTFEIKKVTGCSIRCVKD